MPRSRNEKNVGKSIKYKSTFHLQNSSPGIFEIFGQKPIFTLFLDLFTACTFNIIVKHKTNLLESEREYQ